MNAAEFNALYEVGIAVFAYPGARPEDGGKRLVTRTREKAEVLSGHTDVVWVEGHGACIQLTHVDVVSEDVWEAARTADAVAELGALPMPVGAPKPDGLTRVFASVAALREEPHDSPLHHDYRIGRDLPEPKPVCRCDDPDVDPYACEADDCTASFPELNPFAGGSVEGFDAKVSKVCGCGWRTSVWHVGDGSAEEELHRHVTREHGGAYLAESGGA